MKAILTKALGALVVVAMASAAQAGTVTWTDWTGGTVGAAGSASGTMGSIGVRYVGDVSFIQTGTGTDYFNPSAPYTSATVSNRPTAAEMVALRRSGIRNTVTFGSAVTNPVMSLVSVGRTGTAVTYDFDTPFTILSQGTGYWGGGPTSFTTASGDRLIGREAHGTIQFQGTVSSISWVNAPSENWHGITFGVLDTPAVPLPPAGWMGVGLLGMLALRRVRRRK